MPQFHPSSHKEELCDRKMCQREQVQLNTRGRC